MAMNLVKSFDQGVLLENLKDPASPSKGGVCFRVAFKWTALSLVQGTFKYEALNIDKTAKKQDLYLGWLIEEVKKGFNPAAEFNTAVDRDLDEARNYIDQWGARFTDGATKAQYTGVHVANTVQEPITAFLSTHSSPSSLALLYCYWGLENEGTPSAQPWAHMTGYFNGQFFDPNSGVYGFSSAAGAAIGGDIDAHVASTSRSPVKRHVIFVLGRS